MANAVVKEADSNPGALAEKAGEPPHAAPELMRDWRQTKGKIELTTGEAVEAEDTEVEERAVDATRDSSRRREAVERAIHPDSNRDGN